MKIMTPSFSCDRCGEVGTPRGPHDEDTLPLGWSELRMIHTHRTSETKADLCNTCAAFFLSSIPATADSKLKVTPKRVDPELDAILATGMCEETVTMLDAPSPMTLVCMDALDAMEKLDMALSPKGNVPPPGPRPKFPVGPKSQTSR